MAKVLKHFVFSRGAKKGTSLYPLDEWLDGRIYQLERRHDFSCTTQSMRATLYSRAKKRGGTLRSSTNGGTLTIQFVSTNGQKKKPKGQTNG